jgi:hypothetical protein
MPNTVADTTMESLTGAMNSVSFSVTPMEKHVPNNYHIAYYTCDVNTDLKVTRICCLFHISPDPPVMKGKVENIR